MTFQPEPEVQPAPHPITPVTPPAPWPFRLCMAVPFVLCLACCLYAHRPTPALPVSAAPAEFSAMRAMRHVREMAKEVHRTQTEANYRVRAYIESQLRAMNVDYIIKDDVVIDGSRAGNPENVIARIPGEADTRAVLLMAHYDSTPYGPGAADDVAGCAAMLETCRAILAAPKLKNDIILLFSDGEERGLLGPKSFREHPWFNKTAVMLNLEARGTCGPSYLFQTNPENGWIVPHLVKALPYPVMGSLSADVMRKFPFTTDFMILQDRIQGANVALIGNFAYYHTPLDSPENLSPDSLQHHGEYMLPFARYFGNMDLTETPRLPDLTYFNAPGLGVISYPGNWDGVFTILAAIFFVALAGGTIATGKVAAIDILKAFGLYLALCVIICGMLVAMAVAAYKVHGLLAIQYDSLYWAAAALLCIGIFSHFFFKTLRRVDETSLLLGVFAIWLGVLAYVSFYFPSTRPVFIWPLLLSMTGFAVTRFAPRQSPGVKVVIIALFSLPVLMLGTPAILGFSLSLTALGMPVVVVYAVILIGLLAPMLNVLFARWSPSIPITACIAGLCLYAWPMLLAKPDARHPGSACLSYGLNADTGEAFWISADPRPGQWISQFIPDDTPRQSIEEFHFDGVFLKAPAPVAPFDAPVISRLSEKISGDERILHLRVTSLRGGNRVKIFCDSDAATKAVFVNGEKTSCQGKKWNIDYSAFPRSHSAELTVHAEPGAPLNLSIIDFTYQLPVIPGFAYKPRPPHLMNEPNTLTFDRSFESGTTMAVKTCRF